MSKIIYITGAHSTGKTTAVYRLAHELKLRPENGSIGIITETPRYCPFKIYTKDTRPDAEAQEWIFHKQLLRELEETTRYNIVVSDRSIVDCIAYSKLFGFDMTVEQHMAFARFYKPLYENKIIFHCIDHNILIENDNLRATDLFMRDRYEHKLRETYNELGLSVEYRYYEED